METKEKIECPFCRQRFYREQQPKRTVTVMVVCQVCGAAHEEGKECPNFVNHTGFPYGKLPVFENLVDAVNPNETTTLEVTENEMKEAAEDFTEQSFPGTTKKRTRKAKA